MLRVLDAFVTLMRHKEPFIRQRCCIVIKILSGQPLGKVTIMMNVNLVEMMLKGLSDEDYRVRFHCAASALALADQRVGNEAMAECGFLERVLQRVYEEQDSRIIPLLLRTISRLMATNDSVRKKITQRDLQLFLSMNQKTEVTKILAETFDGDWLASRGILEYLKCGMRSHSYEVVLNCVMCMLRAATVLESKIFLAESNTMNLLVTFALAPSMKGRALKEFALQLLCILVETTYGRKYIMGQKILFDELSKNSEPSCQSYIKKFKDILRAQY
ncbi:uncharacterized protein LOC126904236 isoform X2 [Daktulosphaira vitifoliae]|uniref:uncharacterized protein LOC126904236 isoform X2 n=1 Tax=Daktulosphaira vitifoliae TaxID=58002 RepID=UPI0021AA24B4|nr:uncharacterized protein LOC126904236 isoform X2 [Daktulosphaira vitifoliae]